MLILRFAERIIPEEVLNGIFVENHYHINRDCPQAFVFHLLDFGITLS